MVAGRNIKEVEHMNIDIIDKKLNEIFQDAIGVNDTIWYSEIETLFDCILTMIDTEIKSEKILDAGMKKIKVTDEIVNIIANAQFKKHSGMELKNTNERIRNDWFDGAVDTLNGFNTVIEIMMEDKDISPTREACTLCGFQRRIMQDPVPYCAECGNDKFISIK